MVADSVLNCIYTTYIGNLILHYLYVSIHIINIIMLIYCGNYGNSRHGGRSAGLYIYIYTQVAMLLLTYLDMLHIFDRQQKQSSLFIIIVNNYYKNYFLNYINLKF